MQQSCTAVRPPSFLLAERAELVQLRIKHTTKTGIWLVKDSNLPEGALIEFVPLGGFVKVSAVDPVTKTEVSIVGDPAAGEAALERVAVKKLEYVLSKRKPRRKPRSQSGWDF